MAQDGVPAGSTDAADSTQEKSYGAAAGRWSGYVRELFTNPNGPPLGSVDPDKIEQAAREKLKDSPGAWGFLFGNAGSGSTFRANRDAFARWQIVPRMLRDVTQRNIEVTLFGTKYPSPLIVAPIGCQACFHPDAELATARAAGALGVPLVLSGAASRSLESVAAANGPHAPRWFQLYWPRNDAFTVSLLARAKASGYSALVVTVDTMAIGWRPADLDHAFLPFAHGVGIQVALSDPAFMAAQGRAPHGDAEVPAFPYDPARVRALYEAGDARTREMVELAAAWGRESVNGTFRTWEDVRFLRRNWEGPLIVKGILAPQDVEIAIDEGIDGVIVSNHGGRQIDGSISSLVALERIMKSQKVRGAQAGGQLTVLFDSGIRTGSDIFRALALGAQGILLGRPWAYGLTVAGQAGVEAVIKSILADFELTLGLAGHRTVADIQGKADEVLVRAE
ncbi:oxidoreductase [Dichomitus squalens]|uniref:Oxidoreductase n=1 Tax=Dichomitus squalens TaxID=114155 RepID=A0A4Q9M658_9APHY|nr:oxidoreductase [Dichomitus squalens]